MVLRPIILRIVTFMMLIMILMMIIVIVIRINLIRSVMNKKPNNDNTGDIRHDGDNDKANENWRNDDDIIIMIMMDNSIRR